MRKYVKTINDNIVVDTLIFMYFKKYIKIMNDNIVVSININFNLL